MNKPMFITLFFLIFSTNAVSIENFNECEVFEELVLRDFHKFSFDLPDEEPDDLIYFKLQELGYSEGLPYKRNSDNNLILDILHPKVFEIHQIHPNSIVTSLNNLNTSNLTDEEINKILDSFIYDQENLSISIINESGLQESFEIEFQEIRSVFLPIEFEILNLDQLDSVTSSYSARYFLRTSWSLIGLDTIFREMHEMALQSGSLDETSTDTFQTYCKFSKDKFSKLGIWSPEVVLHNMITQDNENESVNYFVNFNFFSEDDEEFYNVGIAKEVAATATFKSFFNYEPFPFDSQNIIFNFRSGELFPFLVPDSGLFQRGFKNLNLYEWNKKYYEFNSYYVDDAYGSYNRGVSYSINLERNYGYFLTKIYLPIVLILFLAFSTLWIKPRELESRLTVSVVCFLALITYTFIIDKDLPKLSYLTSMDMMILISYVFASIPTIEAIYVSKKTTETNTAETIDSRFRLLLPFLYLLISLGIIFSTILNHPYALQGLRFTT